MNVKLMTAVAALLASTSAWAQGASDTEQTSQDLVCQLADTCPVAAEEDEAEAADVVATPAPATPGARISATRGFKIASKVDATTSKPAVAQPRAGTAKPKARVTAVQNQRATAPGKGIKTAAIKPAAKTSAAKKPGAGRADLRVSFVSGSAQLTEVGQREALKFADALQSPLLGGMRFRIEGHTDAVGNREYNLELSRQRAQAVVDYLAGKGIDRSRFDVAGYGFDKPLPGTQRTSAANRRVEVVRIK